MHSSRLHLREGATVPASLRPNPLSPWPSARAGALSRSPVSLYLLSGRARHGELTRCARSSTDRVADFESEGCRFESCRARFRLSPNQPLCLRQCPLCLRQCPLCLRSRETHAYGTLLIRSSANSALLSELMSREAFEP